MIASRLLAALLVLLPALAWTAPGKRVIAPYPPAPDSPEIWLRQARRAELQSRHKARPPKQPVGLGGDLLKYTAADYSKLAKLTWQIVHQKIRVELLTAQKRLQIKDLVTVRAEKGSITTVEFWIRALHSQTVHSAAGAVLKSETNGYPNSDWAALKVWLPAPLAAGKEVVLTLDLLTQPSCAAGDGQLLSPCSFGPGLMAAAGGIMVYNAEDARDPCLSEIEVITKQDEQAGASGVPSPPVALADGRLVWGFDLSDLSNQNGITVAVDTTVVGDPVGAAVSPEGPQVRFRVQSKHYKRATQLLPAVKAALKLYEQLYAPYPFQTWNMNQGHDELGGGLAFVGGTMFGGTILTPAPPQFMAYWDMAARGLLNHELAHQWWALLVASDDGALPVYEAITEFSSGYAHKAAKGDDMHALYNTIRFAYTMPEADDAPLTSEELYESESYSLIVYDKGGTIFGMLNHELGDELFFAGARALITAFHHDFANVAEIKNAFEQVAKRNLGWFFKQWLHGIGILRVYAVSRVEPAGNKWLLHLNLQQLDGRVWRYKLDVSAHLPDGTIDERSVDVQTPGVDLPATVTMLFDERPRLIQLDSQRRLLRQFSKGLAEDVTLDGLVNGADLVEIAVRQGVALTTIGSGNQAWFDIDHRWREQFDVNDDLSIDAKDAAAVLNQAGQQVPGP